MAPSDGNNSSRRVSSGGRQPKSAEIASQMRVLLSRNNARSVFSHAARCGHAGYGIRRNASRCRANMRGNESALAASAIVASGIDERSAVQRLQCNRRVRATTSVLRRRQDLPVEMVIPLVVVEIPAIPFDFAALRIDGI